MAAPADALRTVPVIIRAFSEAANTAVFAMSAMVGETFRRVMSGRVLYTCSWGVFIAAVIAAFSSWMVRVSGVAAVRTHTTLTPQGLTAWARFRVRFSIAPNAAPIAVAPGV